MKPAVFLMFLRRLLPHPGDPSVSVDRFRAVRRMYHRLLHLKLLEVLQYDKVSDTYCVLSGWGKQPDWVRNVEQTPQVVIEVGRRRFPACAVRLEPEVAERAVLDYARRYPIAIRVFPRLMGYRVDGTEEDFRALADLGIVVAFYPTESRG